MRRVSKFFNLISTKVLLIIIIIILPLNLIALTMVNSFIVNAVDQARLTEQNLADIYMATLKMSMDNASSLLYYFVSEDSNCIRMTKQGDDEYEYVSAKLKFYYNFKTMASLTDGADGYYYDLKKKQDMLMYNNTSDRTISGNINELLKDKEGIVGWKIYELEGRQYLLFHFAKSNLGYGAWINLEKISEEMASGLNYQDVQITFDEINDHAMDNSRIAVVAQAKNIYVHVSLSRDEVLKDLSLYQRFLQIMVVVYLVVIPLLYVIFRHLLLKPLGVINHAFGQLQDGNNDFRIITQGNSYEYDLTFRSFNIMADKLHEYKIEVYERQLAGQRIELRNLQLQIRPHFLLNTFNLIYTLVQRKENDSVQEIIIYLSDYFRYVFRNNKDLDLFSRELGLIKEYIGIVSIRYVHMIEADYDIDPEIEFVRIPPLLIHNFVENAVKYGIKEGRMLNISIRGVYEDKTVTFYISDNGNGMTEEMLVRNQRLFRGDIEPEDVNEHLGLYNSLKRLKFFYGDEAVIEVESELETMTTFTIRFPYNMEVEDESVND